MGGLQVPHQVMCGHEVDPQALPDRFHPQSDGEVRFALMESFP